MTIFILQKCFFMAFYCRFLTPQSEIVGKTNFDGKFTLWIAWLRSNISLGIFLSKCQSCYPYSDQGTLSMYRVILTKNSRVNFCIPSFKFLFYCDAFFGIFKQIGIFWRIWVLLINLTQGSNLPPSPPVSLVNLRPQSE